MRRQVEALLVCPAFPYAAGAMGPIQATDGVEVAGLKAMPSPGQLPAPDDMTGGSLVSNAAGAQAVFLGANTTVHGDVRAVGGIARDPAAPDSVHILGQEVQMNRAMSLPAVDLSSCDPKALGLESTALDPGTRADTLMVGQAPVRCQGSVNLAGGLTLDQGVLVCRQQPHHRPAGHPLPDPLHPPSTSRYRPRITNSVLIVKTILPNDRHVHAAPHAYTYELTRPPEAQVKEGGFPPSPPNHAG